MCQPLLSIVFTPPSVPLVGDRNVALNHFILWLADHQSFFRKPTRPSLPLRKAPPLISVFSPQGKRGNRPTRCSNRCAIRLADHQRSTPAAELRFFVRDEPALLKSFLWERRDTNKYLLLWDRIAGIAV